VVTAEKPKLGLVTTIIAGVTNFIGDALFMVVLEWGVTGAALATAISQVAGGIIPLVYFARKNPSRLRLVMPKWDGKALIRTCTNGSSELMSNLSMSIVGMLYNAQLLVYAGENGVAAYGTIMYVNFIFLSAFIGYSVGVAPVISYHFGAGSSAELKSLFKKSLKIIAICSVIMLALGELLARPLSQMFVGYDDVLFDMTVRGFYIYSFSFLFSGIAIWGSGFFTALNNGLISAIISFLRTVVFQVAAVLILPIFLKLDGIWLSIVVAEVMAAIVTAFFLLIKRKKYQY
jgi:Na+-driven multidrug efflux pump